MNAKFNACKRIHRIKVINSFNMCLELNCRLNFTTTDTHIGQNKQKTGVIQPQRNESSGYWVMFISRTLGGKAR